MAYLHCNNCSWSQDDFYSRRYNPITKIWSDIKWLWIPKMIKLDSSFIAYDVPNLCNYTGIKVKFNNNKTFSWKWLLLEIVKDIKIAKEQKWWRYEDYLKARVLGKAICPKCGAMRLDID